MSKAHTDQFLTTRDAARRLGYTVQHVRILIGQGRLAAERLGRDWLVVRESVERYRTASLWPSVAQQEEIPRRIVNVATVPMRSPFRYPGGKTWLVPYARQWLRSLAHRPSELIEPFAGGGIIALTAVFDGIVDRATLVELDEDVASVWETVLNGGGRWLADQITRFEPTPESIREAVARSGESCRLRAFATIVRNRVNRGGILAPGAGVVKNGEKGRGLTSRWYPGTLRRRILDIVALKSRFSFTRGDGIEHLRSNAERRDAAFFVDPPYTVAGRRLYTHSAMDHSALFDTVARLRGPFLMTYDDAPEIRGLARERGFAIREVPMKNTHHAQKMELLISRDLRWLG